MIIQKSSIAPKLSKLKTIIPSKSTTESIQGILYKNRILHATNLEISMQTEIKNDSDEIFIIPSRAIDLIESLPEGQIEITPQENNSIKIKTGHINNKFQSYDPDAFPKTGDELNEIAIGRIEGKDLEKGIKSAIYAVKEYPEKPILAGVCFDSTEGKLNIVGCDGYRMSWFKIDCIDNFKFVIPKTTIQKLLSVGMTGEVEIAYKQSKATFKTDDYIIHTGLLEGNYMDYTKMFFRQSNKITVNRIILTEAVKRCILCAEEKNKSLIKLKIKENNITISTNSELSEYTEEIKAENSIEDTTIGFNGSYLMDFLKSFEGENIALNFSPNLLTAGNDEQSALIVAARF